jgi:hypothetical protein
VSSGGSRKLISVRRQFCESKRRENRWTYQVKVSGKLVPVRITHEITDGGGWYGLNTLTGRDIRIKTADRLKRSVGLTIPTGESNLWRRGQRLGTATPVPSCSSWSRTITRALGVDAHFVAVILDLEVGTVPSVSHGVHVAQFPAGDLEESIKRAGRRGPPGCRLRAGPAG